MNSFYDFTILRCAWMVTDQNTGVVFRTLISSNRANGRVDGADSVLSNFGGVFLIWWKFWSDFSISFINATWSFWRHTCLLRAVRTATKSTSLRGKPKNLWCSTYWCNPNLPSSSTNGSPIRPWDRYASISCSITSLRFISSDKLSRIFAVSLVPGILNNNNFR